MGCSCTCALSNLGDLGDLGVLGVMALSGDGDLGVSGGEAGERGGESGDFSGDFSGVFESEAARHRGAVGVVRWSCAG